jgi:predicted RNA-binding protein YlqC (UPF0109 family)
MVDELRDGPDCRQRFNGVDTEYLTRLLMQKNEFAKVIGRAGVTIEEIRRRHTARVKGIDIENSDERMISIDGDFSQIDGAFDDILDILFTAYQEYVHESNESAAQFAVYMLVDDSKAGKIIGSKGNKMNSIQDRSGCHIRILKDVRNMFGLTLRVLILEGRPGQIRIAHAGIMELFKTSPLLGDSLSHCIDMRDGDSLNPPVHISDGRPLTNQDLTRGKSIPMTSLFALSVHPDIMMKIRESQAHLNQIGLDLVVVPIQMMTKPLSQPILPPSLPVIPCAGLYDPFTSSSRYQDSFAGHEYIPLHASSIKDNQALIGYRGDTKGNHYPHELGGIIFKDNGERVLEFIIPADRSGAVIGKGGKVINNLQMEFQVKILLERNSNESNLRRISVKALGETPDDSLHLCKVKILSMVGQTYS